MGLSAFEADLLTSFLKSKKKYLKFSKKMKPKHFQNKIFRWTYEITENYFNKYKGIPDIKVFKNELMKTSLPSKEKRLYFKTIEKLYTRKAKTSVAYIAENIDEKIEKEEFLIAIDKSLNSLEKDGVSTTKRELLKRILLKEDEGNWQNVGRVLKDWKLRQAARKQAKKFPLSKRFVPTPYASINTITKGIQISEAATVSGLTGMGKSIIAGEYGISGLLGGFNILHYSFENTYEQTAQRYDSRLTEIKYDTIKMYEFDRAQLEHFEKTFNVLSSEFKNDIEIRETIQNETDIISVDRDVQLLKTNGFNVEFLIIDSLDIMKAVRNMKEHRLDRASVYWDFKIYCKLRRIPGLTTTQLKSTSKWKISTVEDLAEAYDKARILDIVYIMSQTEEDAKANIVRYSVDKHRDAPSGVSVNLFKDTEHMRFLEIIKTA